MDPLLLIPLGIGALSIATVATVYFSIMKEGVGTRKMKGISSYIEEGANAFLKRVQDYNMLLYINSINPICKYFTHQ